MNEVLKRWPGRGIIIAIPTYFSGGALKSSHSWIVHVFVAKVNQDLFRHKLGAGIAQNASPEKYVLLILSIITLASAGCFTTGSRY